MQLREATSDDEAFLWKMLTYAASMTPGGLASVDAAQRDDGLPWYVAGWTRRAGDLGVLAIGEDGSPVGAAWVRLLDSGDHRKEHKVATAEVPELAIGVEPTHRGRGIGAMLLDAIVERARGRYPALALSVRETNPSVRLYERTGFVVEEAVVNRVGGRSLVMRRVLAFEHEHEHDHSPGARRQT